MERVLIVNADDFGLSKGQKLRIVEAYRNGVVTSTTARWSMARLLTLRRSLAASCLRWGGMHFVLTLANRRQRCRA
ncbi:ChbG/HpnK family deacetylase [Salmonella enterica subsp. enterica]|nr:ChbG/HpnK family deacetylase [Salmonella enterica subsp. enterica]